MRVCRRLCWLLLLLLLVPVKCMLALAFSLLCLLQLLPVCAVCACLGASAVRCCSAIMADACNTHGARVSAFRVLHIMQAALRQTLNALAPLR